MSVEPINLSIPEAVEASKLGRTTLFALMRSGELQSIKAGRRRLIPITALTDYMRRLQVEQNDQAA